MSMHLVRVLTLCSLLGLAGVAAANSAVDGDEPAMMASPQTIVLTKVSTITVHTNIPASSVVAGSLALNGVAPRGVGVDNCGDVVATFNVADLGLTPGQATLTLSGLLKSGEGFSADDVVTVK